MANPHKGEVELIAGDETYRLRFSINAMVELEDHFDMGITELGDLMGDPTKFRLKTFRKIVWAGLTDNHDNLSESEVGEIISLAGIPATTQAIQKAFSEAFPQSEAGDKENPRKASRGGTGKDFR